MVGLVKSSAKLVSRICSWMFRMANDLMKMVLMEDLGLIRPACVSAEQAGV